MGMRTFATPASAVTATAVVAAAAAGLMLPGGCARVKVDPIEVKTIHIVHDINIKVDRELDDFFAFQERAAGAATTAATTGRATSPVTTAPATTSPVTTAPATTSPATGRASDTPGGVQ